MQDKLEIPSRNDLISRYRKIPGVGLNLAVYLGRMGDDPDYDPLGNVGHSLADRRWRADPGFREACREALA